jgi:acyl-CoA reductase-like NAD-dependent aldehyde dehydrogenase
MIPRGQAGFLANGKEWKDGEALGVRSPWDQKLVGTVTVASRNDVRHAVDALTASFRKTRVLSSYARQQILLNMAAQVAAQADAFVRVMVAEAGKPVMAARIEVERTLSVLRTAAEESLRLGGEVLPLDLLPGNEGRWGMQRRFPIGPVLAITPFNFPMLSVVHKLAPAIATGSPILIKPSPQTPYTALALARIAIASGWPEEAIAVLPLDNEDTAWLAEKEERIKLLSFTGSAQVGWQLKSRSGRKRVVLELGGNCAMIVHSDWRDLDSAATKAAAGAFGYAGQSCISVQRIFVARDIYQTFLWKVVERAEKMLLGDPALETTEVGPLIRPGDAERVESWVKEAVTEGAKLVTGGLRTGSLMAPTVLTGTKPSMKVRDEEVFGPVVAIEPYEDFEQALSDVNHSHFGLQTGLFTRDMDLILEAYEQLEVGAVLVGESPTWRMDPMPYGGTRESGMGRAGVRWAMEEMTEPRLLAVAGKIHR